MFSVAHVITSLDVGGAERAMLRLAVGLRERGVRQLVVCLQPPGPIADDLRAAGVPVHAIGMRATAAASSGVAGTARLSRLLRRAAPDVVQTWMYHADVLGGLAARAAGRRTLVWNVRHADLPLEGYGRATAAVGRLSVPMAHVLPRVVVTNSASGLAAHVRRGYPASRFRLIPNGVPQPSDALDRAQARARLGLPPDAVVVGRVGRDHPQKDLPTLLAAFARLRRQHPGALLALVGEGWTPEQPDLATALRRLDLADGVRCYGRRDDAAEVAAAFDVAVSSSAYGENCPNTVLEAMAAGVPVVVTDVGDSARVAGDAGLVVPPRNPDALGSAVARLLTAGPGERDRRGTAAAARVRDEYSLDTMVTRYAQLYEELTAHGRTGR